MHECENSYIMWVVGIEGYVGSWERSRLRRYVGEKVFGEKVGSKPGICNLSTFFFVFFLLFRLVDCSRRKG